jgi:ABC-2 type transport system ATP-binding protein
MIEVQHLRRCFGPVVAVDDISFTVQKGDVLGFLGPNGAGKSTAMKRLACFLTPDGGTAKICGHDILTESVQVRQCLGYLAENAPSYNEMTVAGFLNFVCDARGIGGAERKKALDRIVPMCSIDSVYHQTIDTLSKGYRRRVGLAQALIHDPPVLILDEPTDGLDPNQKHEVRQLINSIAKDKCIIVSTHILEEVDAVCSRIVIIANGQILANSTPEALKREHQAELFDIFQTITQRQITGKKAKGKS